MKELFRLFKRISLTGVKGVYDQRLRFEIISVNQLSLISIGLTLLGAIVFAFITPIGFLHLILLCFAVLFLPTFFLNKKRKYFLAKLIPILNVQVFYFVVGMDFGLQAQAQSVYLVTIAFVLLFFTRQKPIVQVLLLIPSIVFPSLLFYMELKGFHLNTLLDFAKPEYLGATTYMLTLIAVIALSLILVSNLNMIERRLNKTRIDLMNANAHLRTETTEMSEKIRAAAHDLRSPLTSAVSLSELLNIEENEADREEMHSHLHDSLRKLKNQVDEIMTEKDAGGELMELMEIEFDEELNEVLDLVKHYPGFRNIKLNVDVDQKAPLVSDKKYLNVILSNILSNSIKYSDDEKPQSYINITGTIDEDQMKLRIEDNGIGIPEGKLPQIFRKNVRATEVSEGTGLGLSLVKRTLQILEGDIDIDSKKGEGTMVKLSLNNYANEL